MRRHLILSLLLFVLTAVLLTATGLHLAGLRHYRLAQAAIEQRDIDTARQHLQFCLSVWPYDSECRLVAARIERLDGNFARFEEYLQECRRLQSGPSERDQLEAILQRAQKGEFEHLKGGLVLWLKAHPEHPDSPYVWEVLAAGEAHKGRLSVALTYLNHWLKLQPDCPTALAYRGSVRSQLDMNDDACNDFRRALQIAPTDWKARLAFLKLLVYRNDAAEAAQQVKYLLEKRPDDLEVKLLHGRVLFMQQQLDAARKTLTEVIDEGSKDVYAPLTLAQLELQAGNAHAAEKWARQSIKLDPTMFECHYRLYRSLLLQPNRQKEAKQVFALCERLKDYAEKIKNIHRDLMEKELTGVPVNDPQTLTRMGELWLKMGSQQKGILWLKRALSSNPHYKPAQLLLEKYLPNQKGASLVNNVYVQPSQSVQAKHQRE